MEEELAIIKDIHIGVRDTSKCICWFNVEMLVGCSLQIIPIEEISKILTENNIYKLEDLNNKPCIVITNNHTVKFKNLKS